MKKQVMVDAGMIWIGDPCYVMGNNASHGVKEWSDFCEKISSEGFPNACEPLGHGVGVAVSSGYGDGIYDVDIEESDEGQWGKRVKRVTITFIEDE